MFTIYHTKKILQNPKNVFLYILDLLSGTLQLVKSHFENNILFIDMYLTKLKHWKCITFGYTENVLTLADFSFICFIKLGGQDKYQTHLLEKSS